MKVYPTKEVLNSLFDYNENTGIFIWKNSICNVKQGDIAGVANRGYVVIGINGCTFLAHRLAWIYVNGEINETIDHINHIRNDNRMCNLRPASRLEQNRNRTKQINNTSGHTGISFVESRNRWRARIKVEGKDIHLGFYKTINEAIKARYDAKILYSFHTNHQ